MLDLDKLRAFITVVKTGSFVRAAEELDLTQPAISRNIQVLERQFGVRLMDRDRGGVRLTQVGRHILDQSVDLLSNARSIEKSLLAAAEGLAGTVRFGIGPFSATLLLPKAIARYTSAGRRLHAEVTIGSGSEMTQQLLADDLEFFIGAQNDFVNDATFLCTPLTEVTPRFYVRPGHPLAGTSPTFAQVREYPLASGSEVGAVIDLSSRGAADEPSTFLVNNLEVLTQICRATDAVLLAGVSLIPEDFLELTVSGAEQPVRSTLGIISVRNRTPSPATELMRSELIREAQSVYG